MALNDITSKNGRKKLFYSPTNNSSVTFNRVMMDNLYSTDFVGVSVSLA